MVSFENLSVQQFRELQNARRGVYNTEGGMDYRKNYRRVKLENLDYTEKPNKNEKTIKEPHKKAPTIFDKMSNSGDIGVLIFAPKVYSNTDIVHTKTQKETIQTILSNNKYLDEQRKQELMTMINNDDFAFYHGARESEILSITNEDVDLLKKYVSGIADKSKMHNGGKHIESLRKSLAIDELAFRKEYFRYHSENINKSDVETINPNQVLTSVRSTFTHDVRILNNEDGDEPETTVTFSAACNSPLKYKHWNSRYRGIQDDMREEGKFVGFETVDTQGVNPYTKDGEVDMPSRVLGEYSVLVADDLSTTCQCFTGLKHTLLSAGVISDYGDIKDVNGEKISKPRDAAEWFASQPEKFTEIKYVDNGDGTIRKINSTDLYDLPAGYIVLQIPEEGNEFANEAGHAGITNGNGQLNGDHPDSFRWEYFKKGEHGTIRVFKLADTAWKFNPTTKKLESTCISTNNADIGPLESKYKQKFLPKENSNMKSYLA